MDSCSAVLATPAIPPPICAPPGMPPGAPANPPGRGAVRRFLIISVAAFCPAVGNPPGSGWRPGTPNAGDPGCAPGCMVWGFTAGGYGNGCPGCPGAG